MKQNSLRRLFAALLVITIVSPVSSQVDQEALAVAEATIDKMGGMESWDQKRFLVWDIFGESHYWDKWTGDFRWEDDSLLVLMNIQSMDGRAWIEGNEIQDPVKRKELLDMGYSNWVNNSYWLIMPYKLLDEGVTRRYVGVDTSLTGQISDVIELTFDHVGLTPQNKYHIYVDRESGMVCQWAYYENFDDEEPEFIRPWDEWKEYDGIWMSTGRGSERRRVTNLSLPDKLPEGLFTDPGFDTSIL